MLRLLILAAVLLVPSMADAHCHPGHEEGASMEPPPVDPVLVKGEFALTDVKTGKAATKSSYDGRWRLVFFGFHSS